MKYSWLETHGTGHRSTQVTVQDRPLQVNYAFSTKSDIWSSGWQPKLRGTHPWCHPPSDHMVTWSHVTKQKILSPLLQNVWPWRLPGYWLMMRGKHPWSRMTLLSPSHVKPNDKWKTQFLFFPKTYGYQTWHVRDLGEVNPIIKSINSLTTSSNEVTWQVIKRISPLS